MTRRTIEERRLRKGRVITRRNACARVILIRQKRDHVTPMLLEPHWLPVKSRITFKTLLLTFKCLYGLALLYLSALLSPPIARHATYALLTSYFLNSPIPELKSPNDPSPVQLQGHGTNYPLQCANVRVLTSLRLHSRHIFSQIIIFDNQRS